MELLYIFIKDDDRNIKEGEYNFSPNYKFSLDYETKTFHKEEFELLPQNWFSKNIDNITAIVGKNGSGKTNLMERIIESLCGNGGGIIFYKHNNRIYTNVNEKYDCYKFDFDVVRFNRNGSPLNTMFEECINDCVVTYYSSSIDRSFNKQYQKFRDISNGYLLRKSILDVENVPKYACLSSVDIMQTIDMFKLLLFFVYLNNTQNRTIGNIQFPDKIEITLHTYSDIVSQHPTYTTLTSQLTNCFEDRLKLFIVDYVFSVYKTPDDWSSDTTFNEILLFINNNESYRSNIYDVFSELYKNNKIDYRIPIQTGLARNHKEMRFKLKIDAITQKVLDVIYSLYVKASYIPFMAYSTLNTTINGNTANSYITFNYGVSSGERIFYTIISRIIGFIFEKQGEVHDAAEFKIINRHDFDGKSIIILLDEPDIQLHPEWQRMFMNFFIQFLEQYFPKVKFQIIFTTHSPIMLSDIPKSNVLFIEKNKNGISEVVNNQGFKETFAANIHSLYNNSFFLDGIPIGCFAKKKIKDIYERINMGKFTDEIVDDIYRIGEPLLRGVLLKAYDEKRKSCNKHERIEMLYRELEQLEKDNNDQD